jgi:F420-dependent oxidoreductase-like protein
MKFGISISTFPWSAGEIGPRISRIATAADEAGVDSLWVMDHFFQIRLTGLPPESPMPEAYATLAFLGGITNNIKLGTLVTSVAYRHPGVLVKTVTTLDVLTGGRMIFGVGAGAPWNIAPAGPGPGIGRVWEAEGLGIPFPSLAERFERLEELLQIAHQMWRGDERPYQGTHYQLVRPLNSPNSLQRPHPPILIGGSGEGKTLRLVAQYADACNLFDIQGSQFRDNLSHKLKVLKDHCDRLGRDFATIEKTVSTSFDLGEDPKQGAAALLAHLRELAATGIGTALVAPGRSWDEASFDAVAAILPDIHAIEPTAA